jgi:lipopolysaccharide/colanic/teichoic acid biosynthesis glycosyltransferase
VTPAAAAAKRVIDLVGALLLLTVTGPIIALAALAIRLSERGPVIYRAVRVGRDGFPFVMLKFRTMIVDAENHGGPSTPADDPRVTGVGRFLRHWKIDELPQLVNVLRGDMSLVGPRPQVASDVARYGIEERRLLTVRPGITDWASLRFRNEAELLAGHADPDEAYDLLIRNEKIRLGLAYVDDGTLRHYFRILWATLRAMSGTKEVVPEDL